MHVLYFWEGRDGTPHDDIIKKFLQKLLKSISQCEITFLGQIRIT